MILRWRRHLAEILPVGVVSLVVLLYQPVALAQQAQPPGTIVEDFTRDTIGGDPASFNTLAGFWSIASGDDGRPALLEDGRQWENSSVATALADQARSVYGERWAEFIDDLAETGYFPISVFKGADNFTSGTLSMRFKVLGGNIDQDCGLLFDYQPNGDYLALRSDTQENNMLLYRWTQGQPIPLKRVPNVPTSFREWHEQTLVVSGRRVAGFLDGALWLQVDLDAPVSGKVGLWSKTDTIVVFDSFTVEPGVVPPSVSADQLSPGGTIVIHMTNLNEAVDWATQANLKGAHSEFVQFLGDWDTVKDAARQRSPEAANAVEAAIAQLKTVLLDPNAPVPDQAVYSPLLQQLQQLVQQLQTQLSQ